MCLNYKFRSALRLLDFFKRPTALYFSGDYFAVKMFDKKKKTRLGLQKINERFVFMHQLGFVFLSVVKK